MAAGAQGRFVTDATMAKIPVLEKPLELIDGECAEKAAALEPQVAR